MTKLFKPEKLSISKLDGINEKSIQQMIADDPAILGLGDLILKDKERIQPRAGRLDLLLQDSETTRRYEVEIQLGINRNLMVSLDKWTNWQCGREL